LKYKTVMQIREQYEGEKTKLLTQTFDFAAKAGAVEVDMPAATKERRSPKEYSAVRVAEVGARIEEERQKLKAKYVELDAEMLAAIEARTEEIEAELAPKNATFQDFAAAATAPSEALIAAMDLALASGDEDAALVALAAARRRDLEDVVGHAIDMREDWAGLIAELTTAQNLPELDPGDVFETFAEKAPAKADIVRARPISDIDVLGVLGTGGG
jgi:hypothetical protein